MITLASKYANYFIQNGEEKGFSLLRFDVVVSILNTIYLDFMKDGIDGIEKIPQEKKIKYYNISGKYFIDKSHRIKASKAAYILELITSNY